MDTKTTIPDYSMISEKVREILPFNIRMLRIINGLSQEYICELTSISRSTYGRIESGKVTPDMMTICILLDYYKITFEDLVSKPVVDINCSKDYLYRTRDHL